MTLKIGKKLTQTLFPKAIYNCNKNDAIAKVSLIAFSGLTFVWAHHESKLYYGKMKGQTLENRPFYPRKI